MNYEKVTDLYFKEFLLSNYVLAAPVLIGGKNIPMNDFWNKSVKEMNDSEFFLSVLSLSGKIKAKSISIDYVFDNFGGYIDLFNLNKKELKKAILDMISIIKK